MLQSRRWRIEQEVVVAAGWGGGEVLERIAAIDRVALPGPGDHIYTPQPLMS